MPCRTGASGFLYTKAGKAGAGDHVPGMRRGVRISRVSRMSRMLSGGMFCSSPLRVLLGLTLRAGALTQLQAVKAGRTGDVGRALDGMFSWHILLGSGTV